MPGTVVCKPARMAVAHFGPKWVDSHVGNHAFALTRHQYCNRNISVKSTRNIELHFPDDVVSLVRECTGCAIYDQVDDGRLMVQKGSLVVIFYRYDTAPPLKTILAVFQGSRQLARVRKGKQS